MTTPSQSPAAVPQAPSVGIGSSELLGWLRGKVVEAEKAVATREEMAETWRMGTDAEWNAAAAMHPSTAGNVSTKRDRLHQAEMHDRIAAKLRRELKMFRATLDALSLPNL